jgi:hypothetical protein
MLKKDSICSQILTPKQLGPICWFMSLFVAMFYSQRNRKILLEASEYWDQYDVLFKTLYNVLHNKYLKKSVNGEEDYDDFSDNTFIKILSLLFKKDKKLFPFNPEHENMKKAFSPQLYIGKLYTLLGIDYKMFDYNKRNDKLRYSYLNKEYDDLLILEIKNENYSKHVIDDKEGILIDHKYIDNGKAPPILIIMVKDNEHSIYERILSDNVIPNESENSNIRYMNDNVTYNEKNYTLDSVVLFNSNTEDNNRHIIAGITCEDERYIYNGWIKKSTDAKGITRDIPCELMPYNWNIMFDNYFCLDTQNCILDILKTKVEKRNFCFNFSQGTRILIYVRDDYILETPKYIGTYFQNIEDENILETPKESSSHLLRNKKKYKTINWNKLSNNSNAVEVSSVESKGGKNIRNTISRKSPKKCPKGKVLNPKTGRYINKKPYKKGGGNTCSKILTPIQVGPTCWFMATFVAMFYSQLSRKILLEASGNWGDGGNDRLFRFLRYILNKRYLKDGEDIKNYKKFSNDFFNTILELLYKKNKDLFPYNPKDILDGFYPDIYLARLYKLLNIDYKIFDYINYEEYYSYSYQNKYNVLSYSYFNKEYDNILEFEINDKKSLKINIEKSTKKLNEHILKKDGNKFKYVDNNEAPSILIIRNYNLRGLFVPKFSEENDLLISKKVIYNDDIIYNDIVDDDVPLLHTDVKDEKKNTVNNKKIYDELTSMRDEIIYNNQEYRLDSIILQNYNYSSNNHAICGITCKNKKYIYNGWTGISNDPSITQNITRNIPCGLMKYNWDTKNDEDFTIVSNKCEPILLKYNDLDNYNKNILYFNFSKSPKYLIYVRKDATTENSEEKSSPPPPPELPLPELPKGWEQQKTIDGEVYYTNHNDKTTHWVLPSEGGAIRKSTDKKSIRNKCPKGKVLNPKTGRYINKKPYKKGGGNTCSKILTPIQVGPTCWFMATFVAMFYSQRSRKLLLEASKTWGDGGNDRLFRFLRHILNNRYLKDGEDIENYKKFSDEFFNTILELLYNKNKDIFPYNPKDILDGFYSDIYLPRLYKLLNIDYKIFDYINYINYNLYDTYTYENKNELSYSYFNKEYDNILKFEINDKKSLKINIEKSTKKLNEHILEKDKNKFEYVEDGEAPPILIIRHWKIEGIIDPKMSEEYNLLISKKIIYTDKDSLLNTDKVPLLYTNVPGEVPDVPDEVPDVPDVSVPVKVPLVHTDVKDDKKELYNELTSMKDKITYNNQEYRLDSIILQNYNYSSNNHAICGITCKNKKYIYNGWTGITNDPSITQNITRNIPCGLMKYDWDTKKDKDFTIFPNKCEPIILKYKDIKDILYFNFSKTPKFLIYVRKNATTENSEEHSPPRRSPPSYSSLYPTHYPQLYPTVNPTPYYPPLPEPQLPEGWERRIAYNGNIFYRNNKNNTVQWNFPSEGGTKKKSTGKKSIHNKKSAKKPPEGKVLNPKTGRYILIKNALNKNEVKSKSSKKCPKGKVLNPKTGRYILIKK